jgi:hypothetical protein
MSGETITVTIGGEAVPVPPMSFAALKRAWAAIQALPGLPDVIGQAEAMVEILAAALARTRPDLTAAAIEDRLQGAEFLTLLTQAPLLLEASGLVAGGASPPGEQPPAPGIPSIP